MGLKGLRVLTSLLLIFCLLLNTGCRKEIPYGKFQNGVVALTFDDNFIDNWYSYMPLLDSLNIKATFYVSHYHRFTDEQKAKLKSIAAKGHEIAFHTATHPDMVKAVKKKGMAKVMHDEIEKDLDLMKKDGFSITNFAYPFGSYDASLNTSLLRMFKSLRCVTGKDNYHKGFISENCDQHVIFGVPVDMNAAIDDGKITEFIQTARDQQDCLVLFAHQIQKENAGYQITTDRIKLIAKQAAARKMKFVRIIDIQ